MALMPANSYAAWRAQARGAPSLQELDTAPPEALLQQIWLRQRLTRDRLRTLDGQPLTILHPGFWNRQPGPDFRNAIIRIGSEPPRSGDIELDLVPQGWTQHGHHTNPAYKNVILHVVWETPSAAASSIPCLALKPHLDSPWPDLARWLDTGSFALVPEGIVGKCSGPLRDLGKPELEALLCQAAAVRLAFKAEQLQARARQAGWEQALWEGLLAGLGYKHNTWPMRRLAEMLPARNAPCAQDPLELEARFLGLSGLLPSDSSALPLDSARRLKSLWSSWWREQESHEAERLPRQIWRLDTIRPANHPQRRVALAAAWAADPTLIARIEKWFVHDSARKDSPELLATLLQGGAERDFWTEHCTFRSARLKKPQPLLGKDRVSDLAINVILPWFYVRARAGKNAQLEQAARDRYFNWPASQDNSALKLARERLFAGAAIRLDRAALQQGLLQITRDFCDHSNALCDDCLFPQLVRGRGLWK